MKAIINRLLESAPSVRNGVLLALTLISWWGVSHLGPPKEGPIKLTPGKVDYYARGFQRKVMDEAGTPKELLLADEMVHYEADDRSELSNPVMNLYQAKGPPWVIRSETATIPKGNEEIFLHGAVLVTRDANEQGKTMRIETTNARVQPNKDYAETDEDIRVLSPPDTMTGTGAKITFGDNLHYQILANVRRLHEIENP